MSVFFGIRPGGVFNLACNLQFEIRNRLVGLGL